MNPEQVDAAVATIPDKQKAEIQRYLDSVKKGGNK